MKPYLDEMLRLTAEIAEELLVVKDTDNDISIALSNKISRLAEIATKNAIDPDRPYYQNYNSQEKSYPSENITDSEISQETECEETIETNVETNDITESQTDSVEPDTDVSTIENEIIEEDNVATPTTINEDTATIDIVDENICDEITEENAAEVIVETIDSNETATIEIVSETERNNNDTENTKINNTTEMTEDESEQNVIIEEICIDEEITEPEEEPVINDTAPQQDSQNSTRQITASLEQMRSAFSLNDLFLFRRIICGGSTALFDKALCDISTMNSVDEITTYLTENFNVNPRNPDVKEFIAIVSQFIYY